jgi:hypothetical protein
MEQEPARSSTNHYSKCLSVGLVCLPLDPKHFVEPRHDSVAKRFDDQIQLPSAKSEAEDQYSRF